MMKRLKLRSVLTGLLVIASITVLSPIGASASEWKQDSIGWKWYKDDGNYAIGWQQVDGNWYYFYYGGYLAQDTFIDSQKYYVDSNGVYGKCPDKARELKAHNAFSSEKESTQKMQADLNRKLSSGLTLGEAEKKIEDSIKKIAKSEKSYESMQGETVISDEAIKAEKSYESMGAEVAKEAKEYGTSLDELKYITSTGNTAWKQNNTGWWFEEDNSYAIGWRWIDGHWYHFDSNGYMEHDTCIVYGNNRYAIGSNGRITSSTGADGSLGRAIRAANGESTESDIEASSQAASASTSSSYAKNNKTDNSKVLSSGMTLKQAKLKVDSVIAGIKALGDTAENNMDYINKLCASMGTTYDEIKSFQG